MTNDFKGEIKQGIYICDCCGKKTRETNTDAAAVDMCSRCYKIEHNENNDGGNYGTD